jgi:hypothetical protein
LLKVIVGRLLVFFGGLLVFFGIAGFMGLGGSSLLMILAVFGIGLLIVTVGYVIQVI